MSVRISCLRQSALRAIPFATALACSGSTDAATAPSDLGAALDTAVAPDLATGDSADERVDVPTPAEDVTTEELASLPQAAVRGTVRRFGPPGGPLEGAVITVLEHPGLTALTDVDGRFEFPSVPAGDVTLVMNAEGFPENQLGTHTTEGADAEGFDFQAVSQGIYDLFAALTESEPDPSKCQISTTVTRYFEGSLPTVHGEPGVIATIEPALPNGPIYFNPDVLPTPGLTETSVDGGVVWTNVPPGDYVLHAAKAGVAFRDVRIRCRAGVLVNAGPPRGLQALDVGGPY